MATLFRESIIRGFMEKAKKEICGTRRGFDQGFQDASILINCWISFEAFTCLQYNKEKVFERIHDFCREFELGYKEEYDLFPDDFKTNITNLVKINIYDMRPNHYTDLPIKINDVRDLKQVMKVIYRVRNNLFHGGKDMKEINDMTIVMCTSAVFYRIMERFLTDKGFINS